MNSIPQVLSTVSKAIAGAIVSAIVALAARYGFNADQSVVDALGVIITVIVSALVGFVSVYFAPKNQPINTEK